MSVDVLKAVMAATRKTAVNVASDTGLTPSTVYNYLNGDSVNRSTERLLELWVQEHSKDRGGPTEAA